jgi:hypothetical protein
MAKESSSGRPQQRLGGRFGLVAGAVALIIATAAVTVMLTGGKSSELTPQAAPDPPTPGQLCHDQVMAAFGAYEPSGEPLDPNDVIREHGSESSIWQVYQSSLETFMVVRGQRGSEHARAAIDGPVRQGCAAEHGEQVRADAPRPATPTRTAQMCVDRVTRALNDAIDRRSAGEALLQELGVQSLESQVFNAIVKHTDFWNEATLQGRSAAMTNAEPLVRQGCADDDTGGREDHVELVSGTLEPGTVENLKATIGEQTGMGDAGIDAFDCDPQTDEIFMCYLQIAESHWVVYVSRIGDVWDYQVVGPPAG